MESALANADAFEANQIGMDLPGQVDDRMLKDIGISTGNPGCSVGRAAIEAATGAFFGPQG